MLTCNADVTRRDTTRLLLQSSNRYWGSGQKGHCLVIYQEENYAGAGKEFIDCRGVRNVYLLASLHVRATEHARAHPFCVRSQYTPPPVRAWLMYLEENARWLVSTRLNWISLKILSIRTMTFRRLVFFPRSRVRLLQNYSTRIIFFPGKRDCAAATFFPVFLVILYVNRDNREIAFFSQFIQLMIQ